LAGNRNFLFGYETAIFSAIFSEVPPRRYNLSVMRYVAFIALLALGARAADLNIVLQARASGRQQSSASGQPTPPTLSVKRGDVFSAQWTVTSPAATVSAITLHAFLDREGLAKPGKEALYETAVVLDILKGEQSKGEFHMPLREPGTYILHVETVGASALLGHEVSAALRVTVP
jgi:hypothetical protein